METTPDLCGWQNLDGFDLGVQDETDWLWRSGDAGREEGGPATDHTLEIGAGHYLLLPTTGPARLLSRPLLPNTSYCLELQATLRPPATLLLTYRDIRTGAEEPGVTWRGGAAGWTRLQLQLTPRQDTFWLELTGSATSQFPLALDDLLVEIGECEFEREFDCGDGSSVAVDRVCDLVPDCPTGQDEAECGSCDVESGLCGWENTGNSDYYWGREEAGEDWGPDHTNSTPPGHFLRLTNDDIAHWDRAALTSPALRRTHSTCRLDYWYQTWVSDGAYLEITVYIVPRGEQPVWQHSNPFPAYNWTRASVYLGRHLAEFRLEVRSRPDQQGDTVLLDDLAMVECELPAPGPAPCPEYTCSNGVCLGKP